MCVGFETSYVSINFKKPLSQYIIPLMFVLRQQETSLTYQVIILFIFYYFINTITHLALNYEHPDLRQPKYFRVLRRMIITVLLSTLEEKTRYSAQQKNKQKAIQSPNSSNSTRTSFQQILSYSQYTEWSLKSWNSPLVYSQLLLIFFCYYILIQYSILVSLQIMSLFYST